MGTGELQSAQPSPPCGHPKDHSGLLSHKPSSPPPVPQHNLNKPVPPGQERRSKKLGLKRSAPWTLCVGKDRQHPQLSSTHPCWRSLCTLVQARGAIVGPGGRWHLGRRGGPTAGNRRAFHLRGECGEPGEATGTPSSPSQGPSPCSEKASSLAPALCHADLQEASGLSPTLPPPWDHFVMASAPPRRLTSQVQGVPRKQDLGLGLRLRGRQHSTAWCLTEFVAPRLTQFPLW